jgi:hypothetical protein
MSKNVVRVNLTPTLLLGFKNYSLGYERVFMGHNSVSINMGYLTLPKLLSGNLSDLGFSRSRSNFGYSFSIDARRYIKKRNRGFAPDGLYLGPYFAMYHHWTENKFILDPSLGVGSTEMNLNTNMHVYHAGLQLGYQFVFFKRATLDLVLVGPGLGHYKVGLDFDVTVDPEIEDDVFEGIYDQLVENFPAVEKLMGERTFSREGRIKVTSAGYRMVVQFGFLF